MDINEITEAIIAEQLAMIDYIARCREFHANQAERAEANKRLRRYRCDELFRRLEGLTVQSRKELAETVWEVPVSWSVLWCARHPDFTPFKGFGGDAAK